MFCGYCGFYGEMVFVHSHYQCPRCKNNIAPCCEGETEQTESEDPGENESELPNSDENMNN